VVTIHDIAKRLGISASTVSRALGNGKGVGYELRQKIRDEALETGYRPNLMARQLRQQTSSAIGLLVDEEWNWYASSIADGVQYEARENGSNVMIWNARNVEDQRAGIEVFEQMMLSGVIVASMHIDPKSKPLVSRLPIVFINRMGESDITCVLSDDEYGAVLAITHLLALGHRDIAFINGPEDWPQSNQRLRGVQSALSSASIVLKKEWYASGDWGRESGYREARRMLSAPIRPTAFFSANDEMAAGIYDIADEMELKIPDELSVIGYNDHPACTYLRPQLTTITLPNWPMGSSAVKALLQTVQNSKSVMGVQVVKGEIVLRHSTAPPRS